MRNIFFYSFIFCVVLFFFVCFFFILVSGLVLVNYNIRGDKSKYDNFTMWRNCEHKPLKNHHRIATSDTVYNSLLCGSGSEAPSLGASQQVWPVLGTLTSQRLFLSSWFNQSAEIKPIRSPLSFRACVCEQDETQSASMKRSPIFSSSIR